MSYAGGYSSSGYSNRAPSPSPYGNQRAPSPSPYGNQRSPSPSPYGHPAGSPMMGGAQPLSAPPGGQIAPGTITYTTTTGPDGNTVYHPFKAVAASYQTPQGVVSGIQWVPAEATQILPAGGLPASAEFASSWSKTDWQKEEEKRRRREEKDASRREKDRRKRERAEEREARERDHTYQQQPTSPYGAPPSGRISPYAAPGQLPPRSASPYYGSTTTGRSASPYRGGGALPGAGVRSASPYSQPGSAVLPPTGRVSPYHQPTGLPNMRSGSPYHGGGALPSAGRPVSPYSAGGALPGAYPGATQSEIERRMSDLGISGKHGSHGGSEYDRRRQSTTGGSYPVAPGGNYPSPGYGASPGVYSPSSATGTGQYPYNAASAAAGSPYRNSREVYPSGHDGLPRSRGPSPTPYGAAAPPPGGVYPQHQQQPLNEQGMLPAPEGFSRPPNLAQSYANFDTMKIQDMDDFLENIPRMPLVLVPHDVYHEDWIRLMTDVASSWAGRLPIPEVAKAGGRPPKRTTVAADLIDLWNTSFFLSRGVELVFYKGRERRTGRLAGQVDVNLPGFEDDLEDEDDDSDLSDDSESDLDDPYLAAKYGQQPNLYGSQQGVYGRQADAQLAELREARRRTKERKVEEKRRKKEKDTRRRMRELEKKYTLYLTCVPLPGQAQTAGYR